jgi:hypothetical protein
MRKFLVVVAIMALAVPIMADQPIDGAKEYEMRIMGIEEDQEFTFPEGVESDSYSGSLTAGSPVWDRIFGSAVDPSCNAAMSDSGVDGQYYEAIPIQVTSAEDLEAEVISFTGGDTVIALYCDPFDPLFPLLNVVAYDDDGGAGLLSAFTAADGITLQPGNTYWFVLSTFSTAVMGDFTINFTSATVTVVPVELQSFSVE